MNRRTGYRDPTGERSISAVDGPAAAEMLRKTLGLLTERERLIISARLMGAPGSLLARHFGVTKDKMRQEEQTAFSRIRHPSRAQWAISFIEEKPKSVLKEILQEDPVLLKLIHEYQGQDQRECNQCGGSVAWSKENGVAPNWFDYGINGRPRLYCSSACRQAAYRARKQTRKNIP